MNKFKIMSIPTAKEFVLNQNDGYLAGDYTPNEVYRIMIGFAKLHVKAALKSASEKAYVEYVDLETNEIFDYTDVITDDNVGADVNVKSILKAYPLNNIK